MKDEGVRDRALYAAALLTSSLTLCGNALAQAPPNLVHVKNSTDLSALAHNAFPAVMRDGYAAAGDAPPLVYMPSASACTLNGGTGDGGSQVPTSDGGCWNATLSGPLDGREWGATYPLTLYFNSAGSDPGPNYCFSSAKPCTIQGAINQAQLVNARGYALTVKDSVAADATLPDINCNGANGSPNAIYVDGNGGTIADTSTTAPAAIIAQNGCSLVVQNLTVKSTHGSALFPSAHSQIFIGSGMNFGATGLGQLHSESGGVIQIGKSYTISGGAPAHLEAVLGGKIIYEETAITVTVTGTPAFSTGFVSLKDGSFLYAPQSYLSFSGSATGKRYFIESNSIIETNTASPSLFPGGAGGQMVTGAKLTPMPTPTLSSPSGLGTGGTAVFVSGSDQQTGAIQLTTGSAMTAASGSVTITVADGGGPNMMVGNFTLSPGTGSWNVGALTQLGGAIGTTGLDLVWFNNGVVLSTGQTYYITYTITPR